MPEAIATTKRKFHKLLDTFTTYANAAALPDEPTTPVTARERLALASERVRKRQRRSEDGSQTTIDLQSTSSTHSISRKTVQCNTSYQQKRSADKSLPNFSPWSQQSFLKRLQSFSSVSLWHPKPDGINELAWAKRGWTCVDVNTVCCVGGCSRRVIVQTEPVRKRVTHDKNHEFKHEDLEDDDDIDEDDDEALQQALTARYQDEIINGHSIDCLWRKTGCKDDIYRLQVVRPAIWQPLLKDIYSSLTTIVSSVENLALHSVDNSAQLQEILTELPADVLPGTDCDRDAQLKMLRIALYGWRGSTELGAQLLKCDSCFQRIGLWMYQPGYTSRTLSADEIASDERPILNLLDMHREFCPWRSAKSQQASGTLAGLNAHEILSKVVSTYVKEKRRKVDDNATNDIVTMESDADPSRQSTPKLSREEVDRLDRERESKLQKLKRLLSIKRAPRATAVRS